MNKALSMRDPFDWMMSEAIEKLDRAERMHRKFFRLHAGDPRQPAWEPPVDVLETAHAVLIFVALPGVDPETVEAVIKDGALIVAGRRVLPAELSSAVIHRLELPQGLKQCPQSLSRVKNSFLNSLPTIVYFIKIILIN